MADGTRDASAKPTEEISVSEVFGIDSEMPVKAFAERTDRVPESTRPISSTPTRHWRSWPGLPTTAG